MRSRNALEELYRWLGNAVLGGTALLAGVGVAHAQAPGVTPQPAVTGAAASEAPVQGASRALPSLPRLFVLALENDADLSRQRFELEATEQEVPKAWAGLKPQVDASYSYSYQESSNIYTENPENYAQNDLYDERVSGELTENYWQVQLTQPLFSLERWRQVGKAKAQVSAAELQLAVVERDLALQVIEAYLNAYLASRKLGLLDSKREALSLQSRQASRAFDLGVGDRINLLEAQSRLDQAIADQVQAENELNNALGVLERLTGVLPDFSGYTLRDLEDLKVDAQWGEPDAWLARTADNVQVLLAEQQQKVAEADTDVRRAGHYPQVNLNLSYSDRNSPDALRASEDTRASVEVRLPIYRGGYTSANARQGELTVEAGRASVNNERNLAQQEVRQRLRNLNGDARQLEALKRSIESSQLFLQAAEKGEQLGLRDLVDVLDARADLYDLRIQFVEVIRQYLLDRLNLEAAVGGLETSDLQEAMTLLASITDGTGEEGGAVSQVSQLAP
ncbi:TolC family outer membrane protein [Halomonas shantousis]